LSCLVHSSPSPLIITSFMTMTAGPSMLIFDRASSPLTASLIEYPSRSRSCLLNARTPGSLPTIKTRGDHPTESCRAGFSHEWHLSA
jgi:hypothetical protein